ncbi:(deoxy)nucleoside triphosphate pyrophosphohydrolase [Kribbella sp. CA-293567]|uniref:(deoxy)nucleoside triphosphate pyrophosphohydrolase n=1 Tax=Kribbella sp. CA-293567 TaxID=3002436 RepID=UPI0022DE33A3|nr:(deoxy)nucleoside triphosphate pyrophosphohydrolase [Kribbella sp. CA-293567]WBQ06960.1 (deoxy)nucleoside triphosphate pyrophosphohydrolase [Kribbella sp. CA-293567]
MSNQQIVVGVAVIRAGRVLAALRPGPDGGWEFPGGKVEAGETDEQAAVRELREELGLEIEPGRSLGLDQPINDKYVLRVYTASLLTGEPVLREHGAIRWVGAGELAELDWLPADRPFLPLLREVFSA